MHGDQEGMCRLVSSSGQDSCTIARQLLISLSLSKKATKHLRITLRRSKIPAVGEHAPDLPIEAMPTAVCCIYTVSLNSIYGSIPAPIKSPQLLAFTHACIHVEFCVETPCSLLRLIIEIHSHNMHHI